MRKKHTQPSVESPTESFWVRNGAYCTLALAIAFVLVVRFRLLNLPLERDEGEYAYMGQLFLQGVPPHAEAFNMKLPGTSVLYAGFMAVFGQTIQGVHLGLLTVNLATLCLLFFFARKLFGQTAAAFSALCFAVLSSGITVLGCHAHATHFMAFFSLAGAWSLWNAKEKDSVVWCACAGFCFGAAFITKQQAMFLPAFGGIVVAFSHQGRREFFSRRHLAVCATFAATALVPLGAIFLWVWLAGTFDKFYYWTFQYAQYYVNQLPVSSALWFMFANSLSVMSFNAAIWLLAFFGLGVMLFVKSFAGRRAFFLGYFLASALCVVPGFYFRPHYYVVALPAVAIFFGVGGAWLVEAASRSRRAVLARWAAFASVAASVVISIALQADYYFLQSIDKISFREYRIQPFTTSVEIAKYLKERTGPDERIAVFGSEPELFFYSGRRSLTGYIYMYPLLEKHPDTLTMTKDFIRRTEEAPPRYIIFYGPYFFFDVQKAEPAFFNWALSFAQERYDIVELFEFDDQGGRTAMREGDAIKSPGSFKFVAVLKRR